VTDLLLFLQALGQLTAGDTCPDESGVSTGPCARYDLDAHGEFIDVEDLVIMNSPACFGQAVSERGCAPADDGLVHCPLP
jgi:hypothetical protein